MNKQFLLLLGFLPVLLARPAHADPPAPPAWWTDSGNSTAILNGNTSQDFAPANLGQLKYVAYQARHYLDLQLASVGGAGPEINALVDGFETTTPSNFAPVTLGQLKYIAKPFYDRLKQVGFDTKQGLNYRLTGNASATTWAYDYPWPDAPPSPFDAGYDEGNYTIWAQKNKLAANLGQLKFVFGFDLQPGSLGGGNFTPDAGNLTNNSSGIPDSWVSSYSLNVANPNIGNEDSDNDGLSNADELAAGTDPTDADSDNDGVNDGADAMPLDSTFKFPRQPVPQYTLLDLGPGGIIDMNDFGDILLDDDDGVWIWARSDGLFYEVPTEDGDYTYTWEWIDDWGAPEGTYFWTDGVDNDFGFVRFDYGYGVSGVGLYDIWFSEFLPEGEYIEGFPPTLPARPYYTREGSMYFAIDYEYYYDTGLTTGNTPPYDPVFEHNFERMWVVLDADGLWSPHPTGDSNSIILMSGGYGTSTSVSNTRVDIPVATTPQGDTFWVSNNITYGSPSYLNITLTGNVPATLIRYTATNDFDNYINSAKVAEFFSDGTGFANLTHPTIVRPQETGPTLYYQSGGIVGANFTVAPGNSTVAPLVDLNHLGIGIGTDDTLHVNDRSYAPASLLTGWAQTYRAGLGDSGASIYPVRINDTMVAVDLRMYVSAEFTHHVGILVSASLAVDNNRDGVINLNGTEDAATATKPFRFWLNDDDGSMDTGGTNVPQGVGHGNGGLTTVNGAKDLINYFPVYFNIKQLLEVYPPDTYTYTLSQQDSALNFIYTDLTIDNPFEYVRPTSALASTGFGYHDSTVCTEPAASAQKFAIGPTGVALDAGWLANITSNQWGVLLFDASNTTTHPLVLNVSLDGNVVTSLNLPLSISGVENMYRHINLRTTSTGFDGALISGTNNNVTDFGRTTNYNSPLNLPDSSNDTNWTFFLHGYNVGGEAARGWQAQVFKQLYWSHSHARFVGISWFADPYDSGSDLLPNYQTAVRNAFITSSKLAQIANGLFSGNKSIIAHSLGTMMVASALEDHGLHIDKAIFVNAAIARESFDGVDDNDLENMALPSWLTGNGTAKYDPQLWASNWYALFGDGRKALTWINRFNGQNGLYIGSTTTAKIYSFYSSTENVLAANPYTPTTGMLEDVRDYIESYGTNNGPFAWVIQEKTKGNKLTLSIPFAGEVNSGSTYGGWGFNVVDSYWANATNSAPGNVTITQTEHAKTSPFFNNGYTTSFGVPVVISGTDDYRELFDPGLGSGAAQNGGNRAKFLAETIPALSLPAGANSVSKFSEFGTRNFNMPALYVSDLGSWPSSLGTDGGLANWFHSNMREVAYPYLYPLFDKLKELSDP